MGWAEKGRKPNKWVSYLPGDLREFIAYVTRDAGTATTALSFPYACLAIVCGAVLPAFWSKNPVLGDMKLPLILFALLSGVMIVWFRRKRVGLGPSALYLFGNWFLTFYFVGWIAWVLDFSVPRVYRLPLRGRTELSGARLDLRPFSSHLISLTSNGCRVSVPRFPFDVEHDTAVTTELDAPDCGEIPMQLGSPVYAEVGEGVLGTGWWRLTGEEPRSLERGAKLEDYESWKNAREARRTQDRMRGEAIDKEQTAEAKRKFVAAGAQPVVVLSRIPLPGGLSSELREKLEKAAEEEHEMLSECTGARLKLASNAYPAGFIIFRQFRSAKSAEAWLLQAKKCAPQAEIDNVLQVEDKGP